MPQKKTLTRGEAVAKARIDLSNLSEKLLKNFVGSDKNTSDLFSAEWQRLFTTIALSYMALRFHQTFVLEKPKPILDKPILALWFTVPPGREKLISDLALNNEKMIRRNLILNFMFEFEQFLKIINSKLSTKSKSTKYQDLAKHILKELKVNEYTAKLDALKAPSLARNVLHDGGIHRFPDDNVTVKGKNYKFIKDQEVTFVTFGVMCIFLEEAVTVMEELVSRVSPHKK